MLALLFVGVTLGSFGLGWFARSRQPATRTVTERDYSRYVLGDFFDESPNARAARLFRNAAKGGA